MNVVAIIQARMGSTRLPGKVLRLLQGETMLARVVGRVRRASLIDEVIVATTHHSADEAIVAECEKCSVPIFRGEEQDVLDRYYRAAQMTKAEVIVRITSDCPLIDPDVTDATIRAFLESGVDYASNFLQRTYPRGLDTEVMSFSALAKAWRDASKPYEREHVTPYIYEHPKEFKILSVTGDENYSDHRWTVDTSEDLEFIQAVYSRMLHNANFSWRDVLTLLSRNPELMDINRSVVQKTLHA